MDLGFMDVTLTVFYDINQNINQFNTMFTGMLFDMQIVT